MRLKTSADDSVNYRYSGILVHPTSFPSPYGIGDFGKGAYDFIDFLEAAGQHLWQILPLNPITSHGNSPYQGFSVFAGEPLLISPELLKARGLLREEDLREIPGFDPVHVDYDAVREYKYPLFRKAYEAFRLSEDEDLQAEYDEFCTKNEVWLSDYSLFMALKEEQEGLPWTKWPESLRNLTEENRAFWTEKLEDEIVYHTFLQFCFYSQWEALKKYANDRGIAIIGDIPIFVSPDGADVWANRELFQVNEKGYPSAVAGVPPDYFSATGQKWISGEWKKGPGEELFRAIHDALGEDLPIFAEDLGLITPEVEKLRDTLGFPGMRVLQFAFDGGESTFLPHQFNTRNCICYTGTHDNNTTAGWYNSASEYSRDKVRRYMNTDASSISWDFIRICLGSIARYAIFPIQDVLKLGEEGRMNVPGVADGNWAWRYRDGDLNSGMAQGLRQMTELFGR